MGFIDRIKRKFGSASTRRIEAAAEQIWHCLLSGMTIEVPAIHSVDSDVTAAILRLRELHPNVFVNMLQSKGIVLTLGSEGKLAVSSEANKTLGAAGYFPDAALPPEMLFQAHEHFQEFHARVDKKVAEAEALEAQRKQDAITVGQVGTAPPVAPEPAPAPPVLAPELPSVVVAPAPEPAK
jgi:hypothetical protein